MEIGQALEAAEGSEVTVRGNLVVDSAGNTRLCSVLAESLPPQCGGDWINLLGFDASSVPNSKTSQRPSDIQTVRWTDSYIAVTGIKRIGGLAEVQLSAAGTTPGVQPERNGLTADYFVTEAEPRPLTFVPDEEATPTGFDGRNRATCRFSKPVARVEVTLDSDAIGLPSETFLIESPSRELAFPLADDVPSESTLELLLVGTYERVMIVVAEDGDRWNVNEHIGSALDTVTVVEKTVTDRQQMIRK